MTREEAREILTHNWTRVDNPNYSESELDEAFFMAIEALSEKNIAREIATILENEQDMRVMLQNDAVMRDATAEEKASVQRYIDSISTEAVQVVRCKDCRWWNSETKGCKRNPSVEAWYETDFCKYGERQCNYFGERREE